jgi:hypothetical protein
MILGSHLLYANVLIRRRVAVSIGDINACNANCHKYVQPRHALVH